MKTSYRILLGLQYFAQGIMVPVLSLMLMEKGCSLGELAVLLGTYSLSVFVLELPSGLLADRMGRKAIYLMSCAFQIVAMFGMLFFSGFWAMTPLIVCSGAGRAFASGSADALLIDEHIAQNGLESVSVVTFELSVLETAGIALGALIGGLLPNIAHLIPQISLYDLNLILRSLLSTAVLLLGAAVLHEKPVPKGDIKPLKKQIVQSFQLIIQNGIILPLLMGAFCSGCFLFAIETYWQPALLPLLQGTNLWLLGVLSFCGFVSAAAGNALAKGLLCRGTSLCKGYITLRLLLFCVLIAFSLQRSLVGFCIAYCLIYLCLGGANLFESTMLNMETPPEKRASMLSFVSFTVQAGGFTAPVFGGLLASNVGIRTLWAVTGALCLLISLALSNVLSRACRQKSTFSSKEQKTLHVG